MEKRRCTDASRIRYYYYALIIVVLIAAILSNNANAARKHPEKFYQKKWCKGVIEHRLSDNTRVDCLTESHAYEFDFANKYAEAIGQALHYGRMTQLNPGIVLILEDCSRDIKYVHRIRNIIKKYNLLIDLKLVVACRVSDNNH